MALFATHIPCFRLCHVIHSQIEKSLQQIILPTIFAEVILDTIILASKIRVYFTAKHDINLLIVWCQNMC